MAIPAGQCDVWRKQGAVSTSASTYASVRNALSDDNSPIHDKDYEVYLQGSYRNDTNIRGDSDVDIVVQLNAAYWEDISTLSPEEQAAYTKTTSPATYSIDAFDKDVQTALKSYYGGAAVTPRNKCINVDGGNGRLPADVVVAGQYRRYRSFQSISNQDYDQGITFWGRTDHEQVINYPKQHFDNGVSKNKSTNGNYKPSVRMIKNARAYLAEKKVITRALAPSYYVEGWLFNLPDDVFVNDSDDTFYNILKWLENNTDWSEFVCQNWQYYLFGPLNVQWTLTNAQQLHKALVTLWNEWD